MRTPNRRPRSQVPACAVLAVLCVVSCGGGSPAAPSSSSICFSVSGFNVTIPNLFKGGGSYNTNVEGLAGFTQTVSQNNESHSLVWTNIQNNYTTRTVDSFNARIDGKDYSYPANRCR